MTIHGKYPTNSAKPIEKWDITRLFGDNGGRAQYLVQGKGERSVPGPKMNKQSPKTHPFYAPYHF